MAQYVYSGIEVVLTGRTAKKEIKGRGRAATRLDIIHEIEPADKEQGSFKKWVRMEDLHEIMEPTKIQ